MTGQTYDLMAPAYEWLTDAYSFGLVPRAKRQQLEHIHQGTRVLYVGVGPGSDAVAAARKGATVTAVDLSCKMIDVASSRFEAAEQHADLHCVDLFTFEPEAPFDVVVANFLLDCFDGQTRPRVAERLGGFLRPGGTLLITDTGLPRGSWSARAFWAVYQGIAYATTWIQGITPWLPRMDLPEYLTNAGFSVGAHEFYRPWRRGPVLFESIVGSKPG